MFTLYRTSKVDPFADDIEESLQNLVLAHRVIRIDVDSNHFDVPSNISLPAIREGKWLYSTPEVIQTLLDTLAGLVVESREMQSDACMIDPDHPGVCMLTEGPKKLQTL